MNYDKMRTIIDYVKFTNIKAHMCYCWLKSNKDDKYKMAGCFEKSVRIDRDKDGEIERGRASDLFLLVVR